MEYGSADDFLSEPLDTSFSLSLESPVSTPGRKRPSRRETSLAESYVSQLRTYDASADNGLYRNTRIDVLKCLRQVDTAFQTPFHRPKPNTLPSYRHIHSRVSSFREQKTTVNPEYGDSSKLRGEEVRNELLLGTKHNVLRTMKREMRKETVDTHRLTLAEQFQKRLSHRLRKLVHPTDSQETWSGPSKDFASKPSLLSTRTAKFRTKSISDNKWRIVHGKLPSQTASGVAETCKVLFQVADVEELGFVQSGKLVWLLLALGVRLESEEVIRAAKLFNKKETMRRSDWVEFLMDRSNLVGVLQRLVPVSIESDASNLSSEEFIALLESQFQRLSLIHERVLSAWKVVDPLHSDAASSASVAKQLVALGITVEARAALELISKVLGTSKSVHKTDFLGLFTRPLLKLHMEVLDKSIGRWNRGEIPLTQKVVEITRIIIMSGLKFRPEKCTQGEAIVGNLQQFDQSDYKNYAEYRQFIETLLVPRKKQIQLMFTSPSPEVATCTNNIGKRDIDPTLEATDSSRLEESAQVLYKRSPRRRNLRMEKTSGDAQSILSEEFSTLNTITCTSAKAPDHLKGAGNTRKVVVLEPEKVGIKTKTSRYFRANSQATTATTSSPRKTINSRDAFPSANGLSRDTVEVALSVDFDRFIQHVENPYLSLFLDI